MAKQLSLLASLLLHRTAAPSAKLASALAAFVVGGSVAAAKFTGHPEWNLVTKIVGAVEKAQEHKP